MWLVPVLCVVGVLISGPASVAAPQDHHASSDQRGATVMGFDQGRTIHHFALFTDGGAIDVSSKDPRDRKNREAIRAHLPHIAMMFGSGNFDAPMLVHDSANVPGSNVMAARRDAIQYEYTQTPGGGRVNIVTTDREALEAVHAFLMFQIAEHKTGDSTTARTR